MKMADLTSLSTEKKLIQTSISTGIATILYRPNIVVVGTLFHRARTDCSTPGELQKEEKHLHQSLKKCKYPDWAINRVKLKSLSTHQKKKRGNNNQPGSSKISGPKPYIVVPYHQGLSESYKNICKHYGIDVYLKSGQTIKDHLMSPKGQRPNK